LNSEVEKRLEKIHEHYQQKWRVKSEDFISEIADHKARINVLIEEKEKLMKQLSRYAGDGEGNEKMITYYKQMVVSKDCEINTFRETTSRLENIIYEREVEIEKYRSEIIRERDSLNTAHACEIARIT
jgi:chromosome segregation ATPase